jgi:hypothetical protein
VSEAITAVLAGILLAGMIAILLVEIVQGKPVIVPDVLVMAVGAVTGFFFGQRQPPAPPAAAPAGPTAKP